ncbi:MAG: hypothetical protein B6I26_05680 [Desulfobacteraceae bacterium 4572_130]|nr:MAG: hypothetical protein B6I26_05680 [Desulfobacteraceae bacterium 4572_130]
MKLTKELYNSNPEDINFKNNLAISYYNLGMFYKDKKDGKNKALLFFQKAEKLWKDLVENFPDYIEFKKNLKKLNKELNDL